MVGDGANDCTALKTADVGLSLSEAEASIAAPFTAKSQDISSAIILLRQGRASLDLSYNLFKYILLYSMTMLSSMVVLYYSTSNLDDIQYGYTGTILASPLVVMICLMDTSPTLVPELPFKSLVNYTVFFSIFGQITINVGVQIAAYFAIRGEDYFHPVHKGDDFVTDGYESTVVFLVSTPQYLFIGIIYSMFTNFRVPIYGNYLFLVVIVLQFIATY